MDKTYTFDTEAGELRIVSCLGGAKIINALIREDGEYEYNNTLDGIESLVLAMVAVNFPGLDSETFLDCLNTAIEAAGNNA